MSAPITLDTMLGTLRIVRVTDEGVKKVERSSDMAEITGLEFGQLREDYLIGIQGSDLKVIMRDADAIRFMTSGEVKHHIYTPKGDDSSAYDLLVAIYQKAQEILE